MDSVAERCKQCGGELPSAGKGRRPVYCSKRCKQAAYREALRKAQGGGSTPPAATLPAEPAPTKKEQRLEVARQALKAVTGKGNPFKGVAPHWPQAPCNCKRCRSVRGGVEV